MCHVVLFDVLLGKHLLTERKVHKRITGKVRLCVAMAVGATDGHLRTFVVPSLGTRRILSTCSIRGAALALRLQE